MNAKIFGVSLVAGLAIVCCVGPLLLIALGSVALSAWAASAGYVLISIVLAMIAFVSIWRNRSNVPHHRARLTIARSMAKHES